MKVLEYKWETIFIMKVSGPELEKEFSWELDDFAELKQGRIGLRLMSGRSTLISNFKFSKKELMK